MADKERKRLVKAAEKQGWTTKRTKKGHTIFYAPDGVNRVTAAGTSGGGRGHGNLLAQLKRYGFQWRLEGKVIEMDKTYETWHRELGHSEYRITLVLDRWGRDGEAAETLLEALLQACPGSGPVVAQDSERNTLSVTVAFDARDSQHAVDLALVALGAGGSASGLPSPNLIGYEVDRVGPDASTAQLQSSEPVSA